MASECEPGRIYKTIAPCGGPSLQKISMAPGIWGDIFRDAIAEMRVLDKEL